MLTPAPDGPTLVVCTTCRGPDRAPGAGAALAAALAALTAESRAGGSDIAVAPVACLWSCDRGTSVQLRGAGRIGYVMGGFGAADAAAVLAFARAWAATTDGEVPYADWPAGVLGHFIARTPPAGMTIA